MLLPSVLLLFENTLLWVGPAGEICADPSSFFFLRLVRLLHSILSLSQIRADGLVFSTICEILDDSLTLCPTVYVTGAIHTIHSRKVLFPVILRIL